MFKRSLFLFTVCFVGCALLVGGGRLVRADSSMLDVHISGGSIQIVASSLMDSEVMGVKVMTPADELVVDREVSGSSFTWGPGAGDPDGLYRYEAQVVDYDAAGDSDPQRNESSASIVSRLSGIFRVEDGMIIVPQGEEDEGPQGEEDEGPQSFWPGAGQFLNRFARSILDWLMPSAHAADLIASSSVPSLYFDDTDNNTPSWGNYDWEFRGVNASATTSGEFLLYNRKEGAGASGFVFHIYDAGPNGVDSLVIDSSGDFHFADDGMFFDRSATRLGIGTITPSYDLHVADGGQIFMDRSGTTDDWRLNPGGVGLWFWNQDSYPFRIDNGSPSNSLCIDSTGNVGVGTSSASWPLTVNGRIYTNNTYSVQSPAPGFWLDETGTGTKGAFFVLDGSVLQMQRRSQGFGAFEASPLRITISAPSNSFNIKADGNIGFGRLFSNISYPLHMASGAHVTAGGVWTNASSRKYKENITKLKANEAFDTLKGLSPVKFNYRMDKEEKHVGFIAEDVPGLVASKDNKGLSPMDVVAVLTKVVKEQQRIISELLERMNMLERAQKLEESPILAGISTTD